MQEVIVVLPQKRTHSSTDVPHVMAARVTPSPMRLLLFSSVMVLRSK